MRERANEKTNQRIEKSKKRFGLTLYLIFFSLLTACNITPPPASDSIFIKIAGSTSMKPLLLQLTNAYRADHPNTVFDVQGGGSQLGRQLFESGQVEIGMVAGPIANLSDDIRLTPITRDNIAFVVNPGNSSIELSLRELQDIFAGRILNWQEVDGLAAPIQAVSREDGSGTRAVFETTVMGDHRVTPAAIVMPGSQAMVDFVAKNPNAIGYVSAAFVDERVYAVPVDGVAPTLPNLPSDDYFLTRDLMLITSTESRPEISQFLEFIVSPAGQKIVAEYGATVR
jgi:phosphate transport system substrate-binding protein